VEWEVKPTLFIHQERKVKRRMTLVSLFAGLMAVPLLGRLAPARAQASTVTTSQDLPIPPGTTVGTCTGDTVLLTGTIHTVFHITVQPSSDTLFVTHDNFQSVSGVGLTRIMHLVPERRTLCTRTTH
jgi:hypothetical protein